MKRGGAEAPPQVNSREAAPSDVKLAGLDTGSECRPLVLREEGGRFLRPEAVAHGNDAILDGHFHAAGLLGMRGTERTLPEFSVLEPRFGHTSLL